MTTALDRLAAALADHYRLDRELGAGGMATVYLAHDLKHDRRVAIKVLRPELAAVIGAERFLAEIKTTANLQHPHILPLFDSGAADSFLFYVMPYIEGESLRDRLGREKQLPIADAVRIAAEVGSALDYAHRHGVIHRDIKPENILLHDGRALVADFGIALAASKSGGSRMTETGMSLGTPHYMSPEQAMGEREIGPTSDVYALGCVTYEMLAGEPPFTGPTAQAIIARVVTEEPRSLVLQRRTIPPHVEAAVNQALAKLPADRFTTAREFVEALQGRAVTVVSAAAGRRAALPATSGWRQPLVIALAVGLAGALALAASQWRAAHRDEVSGVVRFTVPMPSAMLTTNAALGTNLALSPDGRMLVHAIVGDNGASRLMLRPLDEANGRAIPGTDGAQQPCFSPDGRWVAYLVGNVVWKVQVTGGAPVMVGPTGVGPVGMSWAPNGSILVGTTGGLLAVPSGGGPPRILARPDSAAGDLYFIQPQVLADGNTVLFGIQPAGGLSRTLLGVLSLKTGAVTRVELGIIHPLGVIDGTLVYVSPAGALTAVRFDAKARRLTSTPVALGPNVMTTVAGASEAALSLSGGTLAYQSANTSAVVGWANLEGGFQPVLTEPQTYTYPRLAPDGGRIAMSIGAGGRSDIWVYDIPSSTPTRLTNSGALNDRPEWTPDGKRVLYRADRGNRTAIWWQPADLSGPPEPLLVNDRRNYYEGVVSPDGRTLAYQVDDGGATQADVLFRAVAGDTASHPIAASEFVEAQPRFSPDGRWIAYVTDASGLSEVVVQPFPGPGARVQVSAGGGSEPVWARDGSRLFYRDGRHLVAATLSTTAGLAVTGRKELFADTYMFAQAPHANYDVSPDGTRFLMVKSAERPELLVAYGWLNELRARMRGAQDH